MDYFMLIPGSTAARSTGSTGLVRDHPSTSIWRSSPPATSRPERDRAGAVELPDVFKMAMTGGDLSRPRSHQRRAHRGDHQVGATPTKVYDLTLADVRVSHLAVTHAAGSETLDYNMSLDYRRIALVTNGIDGSGKPVKNGEFGYDVTNHTEIAPFSLGLTPGDGRARSGPQVFSSA